MVSIALWPQLEGGAVQLRATVGIHDLFGVFWMVCRVGFGPELGGRRGLVLLAFAGRFLFLFLRPRDRLLLQSVSDRSAAGAFCGWLGCRPLGFGVCVFLFFIFICAEIRRAARFKGIGVETHSSVRALPGNESRSWGW